METTSNALTTIRQIMKYYEQCLEVVCQRYQMSRLETIIISFLHNNPGHDTVGEIADIRMLSKGNVSRSADSLMKKGLLECIPDQVDRRRAHLRLKPETAPIVSDIEEACQVFSRDAFAGFTEEDMAVFRELNRRMAENVGRKLERSSSPHGQ